MTFNFVQLDQLSAANKDDVVDVIGICRSAKDIATITTKAGKELTKRDITIADQRYYHLIYFTRFNALNKIKTI